MMKKSRMLCLAGVLSVSLAAVPVFAEKSAK